MVAKTVPAFRSEKEEAEWWDAHPEVITRLFLKAEKEGRIKRLPGVRGATKPVTLRMPVADLERAQEIADNRRLPYQTYIKGLLHQALERKRKGRIARWMAGAVFPSPAPPRTRWMPPQSARCPGRTSLSSPATGKCSCLPS